MGRRLALVTAVVCAFLAAVPSAALSTESSSDDRTLTIRELGLTTTVGFGESAPQGWTPIEVRLAPTRVFGGTVAIISNSEVARLVEDRPVEVAAGAEQVFRFVVPPSVQLQLRISEPGRDDLVTNLQPPHRRAFVIGVVGSTLPEQLPPPAAVASDVRGSYAAIDPAWLELSPRALDTVGALVVPAAALTELSDVALANLTAAVTSGLELVVAVDRPGAIDLPLPWNPASQATSATVTLDGGAAGTPAPQSVLGLTPTQDAWTLRGSQLADPDATSTDGSPTTEDPVLIAAQAAGRGRVSVVGAALGGAGLRGDARLWGHVLQPGSRVVDLTDQQVTVYRPSSATNEAVRAGGISLPALPWLTLFLIAYVVLVGPVNGFVLSRIGRRELAWLTIPAITVVFATGAYAGSSGSQPPVGVAAEASYWIDGHGQRLAFSALRTPREGEQTVTFPGQGWAVMPTTNTPTPARIDRTGGDTRVTLPLASLQVGTVIGWRTQDQPAPIELTATAVPEEFSVRVQARNVGTTDLDDVAVVLGSIRHEIGDLPAGAAVDRTFAVDELAPLQPWREDVVVEPHEFGPGGVPTSRALEALLGWEVLDRNPGVVWMVGTTTAAPHGLPAATSGETEDLGAVVAVGVTPTVAPDAATLSPALVSRSLVLGNFEGMGRPSTTAIEGPNQVVLRYRFPEGVAVQQILSTLDRSWDEHGMGFEGGGTVCNPVFDANGNQVGEECFEVGVAEPMPPPPGPECPPDATCELDGELFEICRTTPEGEQECTIEVLGGDIVVPDRPGGFGPRLQVELYDHRAGGWVFVVDAFGDGGEVLDPVRFLSPLGEAFVRVSGELWPFEFSARGLGAVLETGGAA